MAQPIPNCCTIKVFAFRGDRGSFGKSVFQALVDERNGRGRGPSVLDCFLWLGHAGISFDDGTTIYGLKPDGGALPIFEVVHRLRNGEAFPGVVADDVSVFAAARKQGIAVKVFDVVVPAPAFLTVQKIIANERPNSRFKYGFPDGDGECNCLTWLERLGLPLLSGCLDEFVMVDGVANQLTRRFGQCT